MTRRTRDERKQVQRRLGGERNGVRAEQLRANGVSDRAIARRLGVPVEAVASWFDLQDELVVGDVDGAA